jgi:hypothetical protein
MMITDGNKPYIGDGAKRDYFYFVKLVPHIFIDEINFEDYRSYCYSLNHNSKVLLFFGISLL